MSFKGGFLLKPTTTNTQNIANLFLQGSQAIQEKKEKLNEVASNLAGETNKALSVPVTGPGDYQVLMAQAASEIRNAQSEAFDKLSKRQISIDDYRIISSKLKSEAELLSRSGELASKQNEDISKGIKDGKLSGVNQVLNYGVFRAASRTDNNESVLKSSVDPFGNVVLTQSYLEPQLDGKTEVKVKSSSLTSRFSHAIGNLSPYRAVNVVDDVAAFKKTIGDRGLSRVVSDPIIENGQTTGYVDRIIIDQSQDPKVRSAITIATKSSYTDEDLVDVLYSRLGMKPDIDPTYRPLSQDVVNSKFGEVYKDESGNTISVSPKDMILQTSEDGIKVVLNDTQRKLAQSYIRNQYEASLGLQEKVSIQRQAPKEEKEDINKIPLQKSFYTREKVLDAASALQKQYNTTVGSTSKTLDDTDLEAVLSKASTQTSSLVLPAPVSSKIKKSGIKASSFLNQELENISSIVGIYNPETGYEIVLVGPSRIGEAEAERTVNGVSTTSRVQKKAEESISSFATEDQARRLYLELYENEDFREKADKVGAGKDVKDVKEAFYLIMERYNLVPLVPR